VASAGGSAAGLLGMRAGQGRRARGRRRCAAPGGRVSRAT
jgi:hypothetical protein